MSVSTPPMDGVHQTRTPSEIERLALLEVLTHAILMVRNCSINMTWEQVSQLMDAIHNIPIYLQTQEKHCWETVFWDLQRFDSRGIETPYSGRLMNWYHEAYRRYAANMENDSSTTEG